MSRIKPTALAAAGATLLASAVVGAAPASAATNGGNQDCREGFTALKLDRAPVEGEVITDGQLSVTITDVDLKIDGSGEAFGFAITTSGASVVYVIVKGGPRSVAFGTTRTTDLDTVLNPGGTHYGISNVTFCYMV
jgi:hypothetical protein